MKEQLRKGCCTIPPTGQTDSPVYTFISGLTAPVVSGEAAIVIHAGELATQEREERTSKAIANAETNEEKGALERPLAR